MPQTRANKTTVPVNADGYNLTADLATMADSSNVVIPVASQAERDALTKKAGLCVARTDLPGCPIERCDGTTWFNTQHVEFTYSTATGAIPNATAWGPGALTLDTGSATTDSSIASISGTSDKIAITNPGVYEVWFGGAVGVAVTGGAASWFAIKDSTDTLYHAVSPMVEFWGSVSIPLRVTAANTVLWFRLKQTSGGTNNATGRIRITRIGY